VPTQRLRRLALSLIFMVCWSLTTHGKYSVTGDEPHYLMIAQSVWSDGDLDVGNNYQRDDGALFGASGLQPELHVRRAPDGRVLPVHDVGVSFALLPAYVAATTVAKIPSDSLLNRFRMNRGLFAYSLICLVVMAIVVCAAAVTMTALTQAGLSGATASLVVFFVWISAPVLSNSFLVFPEPFALLITSWAVREWTSPSTSWTARDSVCVAALGMLPWFHRKYTIYAIALVLVSLWHKRRTVAATSISARSGLVALFVTPILALVGWTFYYWRNLAGPLALERAPFSIAAFAHGAPGLLIDRENGLFWWAPVWMLLPAAWWLRPGLLRWLLPVAALFIPVAAHDQWWGGFSPAGRFLVPLIPIFCLVALSLVQCTTSRRTAIGLLVPQLLIAAYGWQHPRTFWPLGNGHNRVLAAVLGPLGSAERWLPSFRVPSETTWLSAAIVLVAIAALNVVVVGRCSGAKPSGD
jgi:hypothetical protein